MIGFGAPAMQELAQVFMDVQTEIIFFALAIGTHLLFFHKMRPGSLVKMKKSMGASSPTKHQKGAAPTGAIQAFKAALRANDLEAALEQFEALQSLWQKDESPSSAPRMLMEQLVKLSAQKKTLSKLLQLLVKLGLLENAFDLVLSECAEQGDGSTLKEAEQLGRDQGVKFTAATYQALIKGACNCGTLVEAKQALSEAGKAGVADVDTYSAYMLALLKWGKHQEVSRVMETMRAAAMRPNVIAFNKILSAAVASNGEFVWSIIDEMKAFGVKPDQVSCTIILKSRCINSKASNLQKVMKLLDGLDGTMDEVLFNSVVDACVRVGRADLLMPFLKSNRTSKRLAVKSAHTYGSIIRAYGYVQDIRGAWDTWNDMVRLHITPINVTLGCMVEALVTNGDLEGGYELIHEMLSDEKTAPLVNAVMYGSLVKGFSHNKCFSRVWEVYDEMVAQKLQFSMVTFNTLIDTCARSGELNRIPSLLKDIDAQGLKMGIVTYSAILKGYCQKNMIDEAFELFEDMARTTELEPDEIMFNSLIDGCARLGLYTRGMTLFEKMKSSGVRPSNYTLSVLVKLADRAKKVDKALRSARN